MKLINACIFISMASYANATSVQEWYSMGSTNKLLGTGVSCGCHIAPSETNRYYVDFGGQNVDWFNGPDGCNYNNFVFTSKSSGYVQYDLGATVPSAFKILC
jgi:hypothetical protein